MCELCVCVCIAYVSLLCAYCYVCIVRVRARVCVRGALCADPHPSFGCAWTNIYHMYCVCAHVCM